MARSSELTSEDHQYIVSVRGGEPVYSQAGSGRTSPSSAGITKSASGTGDRGQAPCPDQAVKHRFGHQAFMTAV